MASNRVYVLGRFDQLFGPDTASRWRIISTSALAFAAAGMISEASHYTARSAETMAAVISTIVLLAQTLAYCLRGADRAITDSVLTRRPNPRRLVLAAMAASVCVGLNIAARRTLAATLNHRLQQLTPPPDTTLSDSSAQKIANTLRIASDGGVNLSMETLTQIRDAIKEAALRNPDSPALTEAARELQRYGREVKPGTPFQAQTGQKDHPPSNAQRMFESGVQSLARMLSKWPTDDSADTNAALAAFSRAVDFSDGNVSLKIASLFLRGVVYLRLHKYDEVLKDIDAAESLGAVDITFIALLEGGALEGRATQHWMTTLDPAGSATNDLRRAVGLFALALQVSPPESVDASQKVYSLEILEMRATAYFGLRQFSQAIADCQRGLTFLSLLRSAPGSPTARSFYKIEILSYLEMGLPEQALEASRQFADRTGDLLAEKTRALLELLRLDPQEARTVIENFWRDPEVLKDY